MLETLMVQLIRTIPGVPDPRRQLVVVDAQGAFVARLDLALAEIGLFFERRRTPRGPTRLRRQS
jgi:hypothetical protein